MRWARAYTYDPNHPHAVSTVTNITGTNNYDANGNMLCRFGTWNGTSCSGGTQITWNAGNLPTQITGPTGSSTFFYSPDMQRYQQIATDSSGNVTNTTYIGSLFEVVSTSSDTQYRHNIMAAGGIVAVHTIDQGGNVQTNYIHSDHLGSSDTLTADNGTVSQQMSFDAFGLRRDPNNWSYDLTSTQIAGLKGITDKGYTSQEQLDNVGLVHMNGRVYDPSIGRMISADPTVPNPFYSQAFNRYAYVYNNPLSATDPSGFDPYPAVNFLPPNTSTLPFPNNQVPYGYGIDGFSDLASNPAGIPCPACGSTPPDVAANLAPTTFSQVSAPAAASPINGTVSVPSTSLSDAGGIGSVDSNNSNADGTGGVSGDSNAQTTRSPTIANALNGSQCGGCTMEAFVTEAGPGALDGMAEDPPKSGPVATPYHGGNPNGFMAHMGDRQNALNNMPHSPGAAVGPMHSQQTNGSMGVAGVPSAPVPNQRLTPGQFIVGGEVIGGGGLGAAGVAWRVTATLAESAEETDFTIALVSAVDAFGGQAFLGLAVGLGPGLVVGAVVGLAAYGVYELIQNQTDGAKNTGPPP